MKLITFLSELNPDIIKVIEHLSKSKNLQRNIDIYQYYEQVKKDNPNFSCDGCCIEVAAEFELDKRTIYRIIKYFKSEHL